MSALSKYESYRDSGVEWLEEIPTQWNIKKLKYGSYLNKNILPENTPKEFEFEYVDIGSVSQNLINSTESFKFSSAPSRARRLAKEGDTIIATVRTYLKAIAYVDSENENKVYSTGFAIVQPKNEFDKKYLGYFLQSDGFISEVVANSKGVSYPAITANELGQMFVAYPSRKEQERIALFLDKKIAEIDEAISKKEELIELLQEQKSILINQAVCKGLNLSVPMKESGIEWIGVIPKHWEVLRAKYVFNEVDERSKEGQEELLSVSHMTGVTPRSEKNVGMFLAENYTGSKLCRDGDLVINIMWAWMGALGVSGRTGIISPSYGVFRQKKKVYTHWFLEHLLRSKQYVSEYNRRSTGLHSSRLRLYADYFLRMEVGIPPLEEQEGIQKQVTMHTAQIDEVIQKTEEEIAKIKELRQVIISEVVTGKVRV